MQKKENSGRSDLVSSTNRESGSDGLGERVFGVLKVNSEQSAKYLEQIYGELVEKGIDPTVAFHCMSAINETRCSPPLTDARLSEIVLRVAVAQLQEKKRRAEWSTLQL